MPSLHTILSGIQPIALKGDGHTLIDGLSIDSRKVENGFLYAAMKGTQIDGHQYINAAIQNGAVAIVHSDSLGEFHDNVVYIQVTDVADTIGKMAANFYENPSGKLKVVGVTGTNGKTTITTLLYDLFTKLGFKCGLISTVKNIINGKEYVSTHTTPDAISIQKLFAEMVQKGCEYVFMEVSSHAVHQKRISGIQFDGAVFTNITHDHLDYHKTFEEYIQVKKKFFDDLDAKAFAVTNIDDKRGMVMIQNTKAKKITYSLRQVSDVKAKVLENQIYGLLLDIDGQEVHFRMAGSFNAYNLMAVYAVAVEFGFDKNEVLAIMTTLTGAEGRFEIYRSEKEGIIGIVDYAHTPDALLNVLQTIKKFDSHKRIITVVGCGGDRDKLKRPVMATVACEHSNQIILTSDNPRSEDPQSILDDMYRDLAPQHMRKVIQIVDREQAIRTAVMMAEKNDIILIAGKGHETYQEIKGVKHAFDDRIKLVEQFKTLNK